MYADIASNKRRTVVIMAVFIVFVGLIVYIFDRFLHGGTGIFYGALIGSIIYAIITYYAGSRMALALNNAQQIQKPDNPRLWRIIENIAITDGLPMPKVYVMNDPAPNAFATGRDPKTASICVTSGLLEIMDDQELEGVIAHEMGHIKNYDIRVSMVAFALTAVISLIADIILQLVWFRDDREAENNQVFLLIGIVAAVLAPIVATMIQLAISRQREYLADATSVLTTRYPEGLERALAKIGARGSTLRRQNTATAHLFFASPLRNHSLANLFSTHPPIEARIARLQGMENHA